MGKNVHKKTIHVSWELRDQQESSFVQTVDFLKEAAHIKVILYSYLILKKMNERITDS